jgi:hypothetical protein
MTRNGVHSVTCRNRHCPACQSQASARWLKARGAELLPIPYFHVVFTVPHALNPLAQGNSRAATPRRAHTALRLRRCPLGRRRPHTVSRLPPRPLARRDAASARAASRTRGGRTRPDTLPMSPTHSTSIAHLLTHATVLLCLHCPIRGRRASHAAHCDATPHVPSNRSPRSRTSHLPKTDRHAASTALQSP